MHTSDVEKNLKSRGFRLDPRCEVKIFTRDELQGTQEVEMIVIVTIDGRPYLLSPAYAEPGYGLVPQRIISTDEIDNALNESS